MKTEQTENFIVDINPDAMSQDDVEHLGQTLKLLSDYCILKAAAMAERKHGNIQKALFYEQACDDAYISLPSEAKSW